MADKNQPRPGADVSREVRLYGRRVSDVDGPLISVLYYGFKAGIHEVRLPTARIFHIRPEDVAGSGEAPDYQVPGATVHYYDLPIRAEVQESRPQEMDRPRPIDLSAEIVRTTGGTFASLVAKPPTPGAVRMEELESLSHQELLARVRELMADRESGDFGGGEPGTLKLACNTYRQSYYWTFFHLDPWGADCD